MNKEEARGKIIEGKHQGWLTLIDIIFDNITKEVEVLDVFQKYGALEVRYEGNDVYFDELISSIHFLSQKICEYCGESATYSIIDGWEMTLCQKHHDSIPAKEKFRKQL